MKIQIAQNIRNERKKHGMMQEQLAEALNVSIAAVSKWERGIAMPDLSYIVEMADLFGISVDALVGYQMQSSTADALEKRIHSLQQKKDFEAASAEAEKALIRYPNDFRIVFRCGDMYQTKGIETGNAAALEKAIELLERSIPLLSQNTNPIISEVTIRMEIAQCLLALGKETDGIELLKTYNVYGMNDALIGYTYSVSEQFEAKEAIPFLIRAYTDSIQNLIRTMCGFTNMFLREKDYSSALDATLWLIRYLESLKSYPEDVTYVDKPLALLYAECGDLTLKSSLTEEAKEYLQKAYLLAIRFDTNPSYDIKNLKFCSGDTKNCTIFDNAGETAIQAIESHLESEDCTPELLHYWEEIKNGTL